jgi:hypothetical protein
MRTKKGYKTKSKNQNVAQWSPRTEKQIDEMLLREALRGAFGEVKPETIEKLKRNVAQHKKV